MTTLLTRLYADEKAARSVMERLYREGFPRHMMQIITKSDKLDRDALTKRIEGAHVPERAAAVYTESVTAGNSVLLVTAGFKPLSARKIATAILNDSDALPANLEAQDFKLPRIKDHAPRVMKDHPRFLTASPDPDHIGGPWSDQFGFGLLSAPRSRTSAKKGGGHIIPVALLTSNRTAKSAVGKASFISRMFWPMKLVTSNRRRRSVISGGGQPFSRMLGLKTTS